METQKYNFEVLLQGSFECAEAELPEAKAALQGLGNAIRFKWNNGALSTWHMPFGNLMDFETDIIPEKESPDG